MNILEDVRKTINFDLGFTLKDVPIEIPCHAYALGIESNYFIGELIGEVVDAHTSDYEMLNILTRELSLLGLELTECFSNDIRSVIDKRRVVIITRLDNNCRDYHFSLVMPDGKISEKFRYEEPRSYQKKEYYSREYSLGMYIVKRCS